jgi:hypothetical protein
VVYVGRDIVVLMEDGCWESLEVGRSVVGFGFKKEFFFASYIQTATTYNFSGS